MVLKSYFMTGTYGSDGNPTPVASPTIAGHSWKLYKGPNGSTTVFSFVASSETTDFSGDIKDFFDYLTSNEGLSSSQYLTSVGAGKINSSLNHITRNGTNHYQVPNRSLGRTPSSRSLVTASASSKIMSRISTLISF